MWDQISSLLMESELRSLPEWGSFGGGGSSSSLNDIFRTIKNISLLYGVDGQLEVHGPVVGRDFWASYLLT